MMVITPSLTIGEVKRGGKHPEVLMMQKFWLLGGGHRLGLHPCGGSTEGNEVVAAGHWIYCF